MAVSVRKRSKTHHNDFEREAREIRELEKSFEKYAPRGHATRDNSSATGAATRLASRRNAEGASFKFPQIANFGRRTGNAHKASCGKLFFTRCSSRPILIASSIAHRARKSWAAAEAELLKLRKRKRKSKKT